MKKNTLLVDNDGADMTSSRQKQGGRKNWINDWKSQMNLAVWQKRENLFAGIPLIIA